MKTTKTAGTSVESALQKFALPDGFDLHQNMLEPVVSDVGIVGARGQGARNYKWFNHMSAEAVRNNVGDDIWTSYYKFCNLRNPWEKTVSWFHFKHRDLPSDATSGAIVSAFRAALGATDKIMLDFHIYAIEKRPVMDAYIRHSSLDTDLRQITDHLGLTVGPIPQLKKKSAKIKIDYRDYYDTTSREKVARLYEPEIAYFGWSFEDPEPARLSGVVV